MNASSKKTLSDINQSFNVLGSEMALATSQFDKNKQSVQSITAKNEVLTKQIDAQKDKASDNITANTVITAQYTAIPTYTVVFMDWDGVTLKTETVMEGGSATSPPDPVRIGYNFIGWD